MRSPKGSDQVELSDQVRLGDMDDEVLVVLATECGYQPAEDELILRYWDWSKKLVTHHARQRGLASADTEDAMQDAVFGIMKAIRRYDTAQLAHRKGCSFRAFLRRVLTDRFKDFLKKLWRTNRRFVQVLGCEEPLCPPSAGDPTRYASYAETAHRINQYLANLETHVKRLLEALLAGARLRDAAHRAGVSYDKAKRIRRRFREDATRFLGLNTA